jgi:chromosomal replication initiator protein
MQEWEQFVDLQEKRLGKETADKWLRSLKVVHFDARNLYLEAKDSFQVSWFEEQMRSVVSKTFVNNNHRTVKVHLTAASQGPVASKSKGKPTKIGTPLVEAPQFKSDPLDPYATLDHFVVTEANMLLEKFISEQTEHNQAKPISPIYIYGSSGSGKTHLLMAIAHLYLARGLNPFYIRAETFTDQLVNAIRRGAMQEFRKAYRHADLLLIDDVHHLARRSATQEELFHTFNALHTSRCPIYLTSYLPPKDLTEIEARLVSRFEWGITLHLEHLNAEGLSKALKNRAQSLQFNLSQECIDFLIVTFYRNIHSLLQAFNALVLRSHLEPHNAPLNSARIELLLKDLIEKEAEKKLTSSKIIQTVAEFYGIISEDLLSKSHTRDLAFPRQVAMFFCRKQLNLPYLKIGAIFSRDHSTVMSSIKHIEKKLESKEPELVAAVHCIAQKMQG